MQKSIFKFSVLLLSLFSLQVTTSCSSDENESPIQRKNESAETIATKNNLVGEWRLVSSIIDNVNARTTNFKFLKQSLATFNEDNTYNIVFKKEGSTRTQSGTYEVTELNTITFFSSTSEIKLIEERLEISSKEENRVDVFIKSDNKALVSSEENDAVTIEDAVESEKPKATDFDGAAVIAKLLGTWKIVSTENDCIQKNTLEFKTVTNLEFTQHQENFSRNDLLNYNISVPFPFSGAINIKATKGRDKVTFDTAADCQFIKKSSLEFIVLNEKEVAIKDVSKVKILIEDETNIKLVYEYLDVNSNTKTNEFLYQKIK